MEIKKYTPEQIEAAKKYIDSDALLIITMNALARKQPLSIVRMGDGEAAIMSDRPAKFLSDPVWLKEYGLWGADMARIKSELLLATKYSDWYCPSISGLVWDKYKILHLGEKRDQYGIGLFAHAWLYMGRVPELMNYEDGIGIVCRDSREVADRLFMKFGKSVLNAETCDYNSYMDYNPALNAIGRMKANLIFVSAGPSGKYLCVEAAKHYGKVIIDTGSALIRHWSVSKSKNM